ncbi:MAG: FAD-dependent oxidoreductase [Pseudomonadota bacterium]
MISKAHPGPRHDEETLACDLLIVGAGIVGLWIARLAAQAGLNAILLEARAVGTGASGGILGALMPHMPERWNPKKQFQFEALVSLADKVADLEAETGLDCGYRRCGRLIPLVRPHHRALAEERRCAAEQVWDSRHTGFDWAVRDTPYSANWPSLQSMPNGLVHETLSARINPRRYLSALKASVKANATLIEDEGFLRWDKIRQETVTTKGRVITAAQTVLTAGYETFSLMGELLERPSHEFGIPVKGQAAHLKAEIADNLPLMFYDGLYIVPHKDGIVAVGSTSEVEFTDGTATDGKLDNLVERAAALCPALASAPVVERWAGLRPKAIGRDPMIGSVPDHPGVFVATGGFKITFGIAHTMAHAALETATTGQCRSLPESFRLEAHLNMQEAAP